MLLKIRLELVCCLKKLCHSRNRTELGMFTAIISPAVFDSVLHSSLKSASYYPACQVFRKTARFFIYLAENHQAAHSPVGFGSDWSVLWWCLILWDQTIKYKPQYISFCLPALLYLIKGVFMMSEEQINEKRLYRQNEKPPKNERVTGDWNLWHLNPN